MDALIFLTVVTFQVTLLAIVAIVFGQSKIAEQVVNKLINFLRNFTPKRNQLSEQKNNHVLEISPSLEPFFEERRMVKESPKPQAMRVDDFPEMES